MANLYASDYNQKPLHMSAHGNAWAEDYSITATVKNGDKVYLGIIPAGVRVYGVRLLHPAAGADTTAKVGFEPVEGDTPVADDDYWLPSTTSVATAGTKDSGAAPIMFERPVKLVLTGGGADYAAGTLTAVVTGKVVGIR